MLKSWSVPKGPSLDPEIKRLAVMVEDHPLDYASFEGAIPKGEYGAGEVIVWDRGVYSPDEQGRFLFTSRKEAESELNEGLGKGKLSIFLRGHKLKGSWALVKMQKSENNWLLIKHRDDYAQPGSDVLKQDHSVLSGHALTAKGETQPVVPVPAPLDPREVSEAHTASFPTSIAPMLAHLADAVFSNPEWIFEPKLDGYRLITHIQDGKVTLKSRRGIDVTQQYADLLPDLSRQPASELVLDGEVVVMDEKGRLCFQCLQQYLRSVQAKTGPSKHLPLIYYVFDILYLDGYNLCDVALRFRKELLHNILRVSDQVRLIDYFEETGEKVYKAALDNGLEGMVAKRFDSSYQPGERSHDWLKVKSMRSDEFIIGGYSVGEGGRAGTFGALLLGYFDDKGKLKYAGHVGTGFDERMLAEMKKRLEALKTKKRPFSEMPPLNAPTTWVRPELVAEVKFSEWTQDGVLRIPVFLRLREDKSPAEIHKGDDVSSPSSVDKTSPNAAEDILQQLQKSKNKTTIEIEGNKISLTNLDKILWPATDTTPALTKLQFLSYLAAVGNYFLLHLKDRPLTLNRYPNGINGEHFYQRHWNNPIPDFVTRVNITEEDGKKNEYLICDNLSTLLWLGQLGNLEFHTWFSRISPAPDMPSDKIDVDYILNHPDFIIFDLDPYLYSGKEAAGAEPEMNRKAFARVSQTALWLKEVLDGLALSAFIKTSGKTGLHIHVPIVRQLDYKAVRSAAATIGKFLRQKHPKDITMEWAVEKRTGKIFIDYGQNVRGKSLASVYSPRPAPEATVSTPLRWEEVGKVYPTDFTILTLPDRLKKTGDLWAKILSSKHDLKTLLNK